MRLQTRRLVLRRWDRDDTPHLTEILSHPDVASMLGNPTSGDVAATIDRYAEHWEAHGFGRWAVEDRFTGRLVGRVGLMRQEEWTVTPEKVEVGWTIERSRWAQGLATEAALAAIADGFERVGLRRVLSWTLPHNHASRRVMEKCELELRGRATWKGLDHVWYDVTAAAWSDRDLR
jgi:RimJ/RimL family protein N-acetyltransferase